MQEFVCRLEPDPRKGNQWVFTLGRGYTWISEELKVLLVPRKYLLPKS